MVTVNRVSSSAAATSSTPTLKQGSSGAAVKSLQQKLKNAGINVAVDGAFGPATAAAVKKYQASHGLVADGVVGPRTWAKLNASAPAPTPAPSGSNPTVKQGSSGAAVKNLQTRLRAHGYNVSVDGAFGPATASAVKQFQSSKGLTADGVVGPRTWAALNAAPTGSSGGIHGNSTLAAKARAVAMSMGGYHSQGLCATGVSRAIMNTYGIRVYGNGNQIDNNLPKNKFKQVNISLADALKIPGLIITWEKTSTVAGSKYGHTAITLGDGHSSASDFIENYTTSNGRTGMKIFMPI